ncbi:hypothetical protein, variant [Capsaspora owczarzaki ATCC 30864]|nr:hypothetical protein, variant [Capsaspora owczarzaki ATCC 30864]
MRVLYAGGFSSDDRTEYKFSIYDNVLDAMLALIKGLQILAIPMESQFQSYVEELIGFAASNNAAPTTQVLPHSFAPPVIAWTDDKFQCHVYPLVKTLWAFSTSIRTCFERRNELPFPVPDCAIYFFNEIDRISEPTFTPCEQDVIRMRVKTLGVVEHNFVIKSQKWTFIDVAGQKSARRKWIHLFDGVSGVVFFVSLSSYDETYQDTLPATDSFDNLDEAADGEESPKSLLLTDGLELFESLLRDPHLENVPFTVLLNKFDLFSTKIPLRPLRQFLPGYIGDDSDVGASATYIRNLFLERAANVDRKVHVELTCATHKPTIEQSLNAGLAFLQEMRQNAALTPRASSSRSAGTIRRGDNAQRGSAHQHSVGSPPISASSSPRPSISGPSGTDAQQSSSPPRWAYESL